MRGDEMVREMRDESKNVVEQNIVNSDLVFEKRDSRPGEYQSRSKGLGTQRGRRDLFEGCSATSRPGLSSLYLLSSVQ